MSAREFVDQMRSELESLRQQGHEAVPMENLLRYLEAARTTASRDPTPAEMEKYKAELGRITEEFKANHAAELSRSIEMFKSVIQAG